MPRLVACVCLLFLAVPSRGMVVQTSSPEQEARTRHRKAIEARARELGISLEHDEAPKPKRVKRPDFYPRAAYEKHVEGTVLVMIVIDAKGKVTSGEIVGSAGADLDGAAIKCVKGWLFTPAQKDGHPVPTIVLAPVAFRIDAKPSGQ